LSVEILSGLQVSQSGLIERGRADRIRKISVTA
jgi:hypothetical protein